VASMFSRLCCYTFAVLVGITGVCAVAGPSGESAVYIPDLASNDFARFELSSFEEINEIRRKNPGSLQRCRPSSGQDKDVGRNSARIKANPALCVETTAFNEADLHWRMTLVSNQAKPTGPTIVVLHDNENAAFDTALYGIEKYGGKLVALETSESRHHYSGQDPNRNFAKTLAESRPCRQMRRRPAPVFTAKIMGLTTAGFPVIALHNNDKGFGGGWGRGTISAARSTAKMKGFMAPTKRGSLSDADNAILLAGTLPYGKNSRLHKAIAFFHGRGINVIYEVVTPSENDCSLTNYMVLNGLGSYFNVEAGHGRSLEQKQMLDALMSYIKQ